MDFRVHLDVYDGPLDLLLYLVRKNELEAAELPLASVTGQFLDFVAVLEKLDVDQLAEYIAVAAQLIELKSRCVLPHQDEAQEEEADPHEDLVQRLIEFKKFRDAASLLEERDAQQRLRFARLARDLPQRRADPAEQPLQGVELWDLVSAFTRVAGDRLAAPREHQVLYDDTPVHVYMRNVHARIVSEERVLFSALFPEAVHKSTLVGTFLAVLELVRHRHALAEQAQRFGDITLRPGAEPLPAHLAPVEGDAA